MTTSDGCAPNPNDKAHVFAYVEQELPRLIARLGLNAGTGSRLRTLFMDSLNANAARMEACLEAPIVESLPVSSDLFNMVGDLTIGDDTQVEGLEHMKAALEFMARGGNVLLVSNHTSGADTLVLHHVVNHSFANAARNWWHMAGHVVNLFLLPLAITGGVRRIQIFSAKYCARVSEDVRGRMKANNARALASIGSQIVNGGQCIVLYPEGGRGEGALKSGESRVMKIPQLMDAVSPVGLMVLPSYVEATNILPVVRSEHEFNEFLQHVRRGNAALKFGAGVMWKDLQPNDTEVREYLSGQKERCLGNPEHALKICLVDKTMRLIAAMAPQNARGPYA